MEKARIIPSNEKDSKPLLRTSSEREERLADNNIYLSDVVKHLIATCSVKQIEMPTQSAPWHFLLYEAKKSEQAPKAVKEAFFNADIYHRCDDLDNCLSSLVLTSTLHTTSPRFRNYNIDETTRNGWLKELERTPESYRTFIDTLSEMARRDFGLDNR